MIPARLGEGLSVPAVDASFEPMSRPAGTAVDNVVILAGGKGTRLAPYTSVLPKPLMPLADRAILEIVIERLEEFDVRRITLCVGYLGHLIEAVLRNGGGNGKNGRIEYVHESGALGTAGPLRLVTGLDDTFIVMNGDVLTDLDLGELVEEHRASGNVLTIAAHKRKNKIDYGVLHVSSNGKGRRNALVAYEEKPEEVYFVSMGIYVFEPQALGFIPEGYFDFPDLVQALLAAGEHVGIHAYDGFWLDIGRPEDYRQAVDLWEQDALPVSVSDA
jgi:NDP-sugar pyrophosphorylase family protein